MLSRLEALLVLHARLWSQQRDESLSLTRVLHTDHTFAPFLPTEFSEGKVPSAHVTMRPGPTTYYTVSRPPHVLGHTSGTASLSIRHFTSGGIAVLSRGSQSLQGTAKGVLPS